MYVNCVNIENEEEPLWTLQIFYLDVIRHEKYFPVLDDF